MQKHLTHYDGRTLGLSIALALGVTFTAGAQIVPKQLAGPPSDFAPSRSAADSGVMSLTGLMGLSASSDDPWASVRKR